MERTTRRDGFVLTDALLTTPLDESTMTEFPSIALRDIPAVVRKLSDYVHTSTTEELVSSNVLYWLTENLYSAVFNKDTDLTGDTVKVMFDLVKKNPDVLVTMLSRLIEVGELKGQSTLYAWTRVLYLGTFEIRNDSAIIGINYIFSYLLDHVKASLIPLLVEQCVDGNEKEKNILFLLAQALRNSAEYPDNQSSTALIAALFARCSVDSLPALAQEINSGLLKGKHVPYMLAHALQSAAKDNPPVVASVCDVLIQMVKTQEPESIKNVLFKITETGSNKGLSCVHMILTSILSASYIRDNNQVIGTMMSLLNQMFTASPNDMLRSLTQDIIRDRKEKTNGLALLELAQDIAIKHELNACPIIDFISRVNEAIVVDEAKPVTMDVNPQGRTRRFSGSFFVGSADAAAADDAQSANDPEFKC